MLKWKKGLHGRPETVDGRFYVQGHFDEKPGYYELVDTKTGRREHGTKLKELKARAETIVTDELSRSAQEAHRRFEGDFLDDQSN